MGSRSRREFLITMVAAGAAASAAADFGVRTSPAPPELPRGLLRIDTTSRVDGRKDWGYLWPSDDSNAPWLVNLHGHGSHGDQLFTRPDIREAWLPDFRRRRFSIVTPNLRDNAWMGPTAARDLHDLVIWLRREHRARQVLLAGGSMGGSSIVAYCALYPRDVAGAIALCPATDPASYYAWCRTQSSPICAEIADAIRNGYGAEPTAAPRVFRAHSAVANARKLTMPLYIAHGARDSLIPVDQSRRLAAAMAHSARFRYRELPEGEHDAPLACMGEALEWLMGQLQG